ncbi:MAG: exodeoxyribonuclease VII large subunit, partial [Candidatus Dadabacteria bacterium]
FLLQKFEQFYQPLKEAERLVAAVSLKMIKDEKRKINASGKYFRSVTRNLLDRNTGEVNSIGRIIKREVSLFLREQHNIQEKKSNDLKEYSLQLLNDKERQLYDDVVLMQRDLRTVLLRAEHMVIQAKNNLHVVVDSSFKRDKNVLDLLENTAKHLDPVNVLKRGFSYTLVNGELIRSVEQVKMGDQLETVVADGKIASTVISGRS